ncbi:hypothetical protein R1sor_003500 [Riccia sorocarpa]|uniref:Pentatricopeptide repeat-containing protein n=1 Tax=Riccia sorocarpa TaxID=122646 RepID=A0ABD3H2K8_9MARC
MVRQICVKKISQLLARDSNREEVIRLWSKMKSKQVQVSRNLYENLIRACGDGEEDHKVVKILYLDMRKQEVPISVSLCNHVPRTLVVRKMCAGETDSTIIVFKRMIERGQRPGVLSTTERSRKKQPFCRGQNGLGAHEKYGMKPNVGAYTTMISACGRSGSYWEAVKLQDEMRVNGIQPTLITYNALITACARVGDGERALDVIEQITAAKIQPDSITYAQLIEAMANEGRCKQATEAFGSRRSVLE